MKLEWDVPDNPYRLPRSVLPYRYAVTLEPDLDAASFTGRVAIDIELVEPTRTIVLNAAGLELGDASVDGRPFDVVVDVERERATFSLPDALPPGRSMLTCDFTGVLNDKLRGFYRSTFTDTAGATRTIATTQFEATDARRAFPCFDEPDLKAVFRIELVVPEGLFAVSNAPIESEVRLDGGRRRVRFAETMKMSTYLVAMVVGPLEATPAGAGAVPLRVVHAPGKGHLSGFALDIGAFGLDWFADYYGIPYPSDKVDLVALPDFAAGAMENLGCITFREALLLLDPATATQSELTRVADVVAHELAHMWFGDLVTMKWWNGLWLNEAFATFMEVACVAAFRPAWDRWTQFALDRSRAFDVDSLASTRPIEYEVESPEDAEGMFDVLTYEKGGSVLRMLEQYLGDDAFRDGIRRYLDVHRHGNTETGDLWDAIEKVTGEPVRRIMDSWIFQGGYPIVSVSEEAPGRIRVSQRRFHYSGESDTAALWSVPLLMRTGDEYRRVLLEDEGDAVDVAPGGAVVVNAGGHGFYRVRYAPDLLAALTAGSSELAPVERHALLDDTFACLLAGMTSVGDFLALVRGLRSEIDLNVWKTLALHLGQLERIVPDQARPRFEATVQEIAGPALARLGWTAAGDESELTCELRGVLVTLLGTIGAGGDVRAKARELHERYLADPRSVDPNVAASVAGVVAWTGTGADYDLFLARHRTGPTPQEQLRYLFALAEFPGREEFDRTLSMLLDGEVRTQNAPSVLAVALTHRCHGRVAWDFVTANWDTINARFPSNSIVRLLAGLKALSQPADAADVKAFLSTHDVPQGRRQIAQMLEKLEVNVAFRQRESAPLARALVGS